MMFARILLAVVVEADRTAIFRLVATWGCVTVVKANFDSWGVVQMRLKPCV